MTDKLADARADLAFMRSLATGDETPSHALGLVLFICGGLYAAQTFIQYLSFGDHVNLPPLADLAVVVIANAGVLGTIVMVSMRDWSKGPKTLSGRAYEAAFIAAGLINLCLVVIFGLMSYRTGSAEPWLLHAEVVFALFGGTWFIAFRLRRRLWQGAVSLGWFAAAIALALNGVNNRFLLITSLALLLLMSLPGYLLMRAARPTQAKA